MIKFFDTSYYNIDNIQSQKHGSLIFVKFAPDFYLDSSVAEKNKVINKILRTKFKHYRRADPMVIFHCKIFKKKKTRHRYYMLLTFIPEFQQVIVISK